MLEPFIVTKKFHHGSRDYKENEVIYQDIKKIPWEALLNGEFIRKVNSKDYDEGGVLYEPFEELEDDDEEEWTIEEPYIKQTRLEKWQPTENGTENKEK